MDQSDPDISFDVDGICSHCHSQDLRLKSEVLPGALGRRRLETLVAEIRASSSGREYDCIIGLSGGVDSTAVALLAHRLGLRPLAVHVDNGWNSELAVSNIEAVVKTLNIDLHTEVLDWSEFRRIQWAFFTASVPNCEIPTDHVIVATLFKVARAFGVRHILSGSNTANEGIMPAAWGHDSKDWGHIAAIGRKFGGGVPVKMPHLTVLDFARSLLIDRTRFVPILNYSDFDKSRSVEEMREKLGWRPYPRKHGESLFTRFFQEHYLPTKFGFDKRRAHYSSAICAGFMTREHATKLLAEPLFGPGELEPQIEFFIKKFGISKDDYRAVMSAAPCSHTDYPINSLLFSRKNALMRVARSYATGRRAHNG
jgi:N-acetyl sugar amidotransferase